MKVEVKVGLTFHLGPATSNQYGRLDIVFTEIDPSYDIDSQLASGLNAARKAFETAIRELDHQVDKVLDRKR